MSWSRSLPVANAEVSFEQPDYHNPTPQKNGPKKQGKVSFQRSFPMLKGTVLHCMHETGATIFPWGKIELANLPRGFVGGLPVVHKAQIRLLIQSDVTYLGKKSIEAGASIHQHGVITYVGCLKPSSVILSSCCDGITKVLTTNSSKSTIRICHCWPANIKTGTTTMTWQCVQVYKAGSTSIWSLTHWLYNPAAGPSVLFIQSHFLLNHLIYS